MNNINEIANWPYHGEILIVDDNPANLELLSEMLTAQRYDVRVANSGELALSAVKYSRPDLILLDINMPNISGYEVCRRLKSNPASQDVPVIFLSVHDDAINKVEAFACGGVDYITKPFHIEEVLVRIDSQLKIARLSRELQLQMLRYQLNPHFLFNALIAVRNLVAGKIPAAEKIINQLSEYLRYLLLNRQKSNITVREELEAAQNYLAIERIRFEEKLKIRLELDEKIDELMMPAFLLQPLLENAIKYGMKTSRMPLEVKLSAYRDQHKLCFCVSNTGRWVKADDDDIPHGPSLGIALQNIRSRLKQQYSTDHSFIIAEEQGSVTIKIEIPTR